MNEPIEETYQYFEIVCECGHDYNEDKTLWELLDRIEYEDKQIQCPKCKKINNLTIDYLYIDELEDEQGMIRIYNRIEKKVLKMKIRVCNEYGRTLKIIDVTYAWEVAMINSKYEYWEYK